MDIAATPLDQLIHTIEIGELDRVLRASRTIDEATAQKLDRVYGARTLAAMRSPNDRDAAAQLSQHLERALTPARRTQLARLSTPYAARWEAWHDLLEALIEVWDQLGDSPVRGLKHVQPLIESLEREGEIRQTGVGALLGLRPANLTRLLNILEANGLIERRKIGVEKWVSLAAAHPLRAARRPAEEPLPNVAAANDSMARPRLLLLGVAA